MENKIIFYLCNGKKPNCNKCSCYKTNPNDDLVCFHTTTEKYAIYGGKDSNNDERPFFVEDENGYLWEGFIGEGKKVKMAIFNNKEVTPMITKQVYVCEYCHTAYSKEEDAKKCEQTHTQHLEIEEVKYLGRSLDLVPFPIKIKVKSDTGEGYWYKRMHKDEEIK